VKTLTCPLSGAGLAVAVAIVLAYGCNAKHVIGTADADGGLTGSAGTLGTNSAAGVTGAAGVVGAAGGGATAGVGGTGGLAGRGTAGGMAGSGDSAGAAGGAAGVGGSGGTANVGCPAGAAGTRGTGGASGTACGFTMPNPASACLPNPASYTNNGDGSVTDKLTGLIWEGTVDPGSYSQAAAATYCTNKVPVGGWRLPTRLELVSLVDFTIAPPGPTINQTYFPDAPAAPFWTSSVYAGNLGGIMWYVAFKSGNSDVNDVTNAYRVRCVRGLPLKCDPTRYQVQGGGLVLDSATGLTWQQSVDAGFYTWSAAMTYCAGLGTGWRLPSLTELQTIVDDTNSRTIDGTAFPSTPASAFWTSSAYAGASGYAWYVAFSIGDTSLNVVASTSRVRCVR
jgi:hypothetical protein